MVLSRGHDTEEELEQQASCQRRRTDLARSDRVVFVEEPMPKVKVTAFRFSEEELELLEVIQGHTGIRSRMEALRTVLQYYAEAEGLQVGQAKESREPPK
jgi:hypothetical protein